jgi:hypothetical protein
MASAIETGHVTTLVKTYFHEANLTTDLQRGSTLHQVGKFPPPVSGRLFSISVFDTRRPVREPAETGSWTVGRRSACPAARGWPSWARSHRVLSHHA